MPTTPRRTLAALAAFTVTATSLMAAGTTAATAATTPKPKTVSLKAAQYPRLLDRPGTSMDVIRLLNIPGVSWAVNGQAVDMATGDEYKDVAVTGGATVTADLAQNNDLSIWSMATGTPTEWVFPAPTNIDGDPIDAANLKVTWNDVPGSRDFVSLPKTTGIVWTVTTGAKTTVLDSSSFARADVINVPVTLSSTVVATKDAGYTVDNIPTFDPVGKITDTPTVTISAAALDAAVETGEDPLDAHKGYGPGAAYETVRVTGIEGVKWKIGNNKPVAVKGVAYLKVDPDDLHAGEVTVTAERASSKYVLESFSKKVAFRDVPGAAQVLVDDTMVSHKDLAGTRSDTVSLKAKPGMTWWVGQDVKQKDGSSRTTYKAVKAAKNGIATYKPKFDKGADTAKIYLRPVANRGYTVDNQLTSAGQSFDLNSASKNIELANQGPASGTKVTYAPAEGITSWTTKYTITAGTKTSSKTLTVKPTDITAAGATSMAIDFKPATAVSTVTKIAKDYKLVTP